MIGAAAPRPWPRGARVCDVAEALILLQAEWRVVGRVPCCVALGRTCTSCDCLEWWVVAPPPGPFARALRDAVDLAGRWLRPDPAVPL